MAINNAAALRDWFLRYATDEGPTGILQNFLAVSHSGDGTLLESAVQTAAGGLVTAINVTQSPYSADSTGVTDATTAINSALTAAAATVSSYALRKLVFLPAGVFKCSSLLTVPFGVTLLGAGKGSTVLDFSTLSSSGTAVQWGDAAPAGRAADGGTIEGVSIIGPGKATTSIGIQTAGTAKNCSHATLRHVHLKAFGTGLNEGSNSFLNTYEDVDFDANGTGYKATGALTNFGENMRFRSCVFGSNNMHYNINPSSGGGVDYLFDACSFDYATAVPEITVASASVVAHRHCHFETSQAGTANTPLSVDISFPLEQLIFAGCDFVYTAVPVGIPIAWDSGTASTSMNLVFNDIRGGNTAVSFFDTVAAYSATQPTAVAIGSRGMTATSGKLVAIDSLNVDSRVLPWLIDIDVFPTAISQTNWNSLNNSTLFPYNQSKESTGVQNAEINWDVVLAVGTWSVVVTHTKDVNRGIYTVQFDGVTAGTVDGYAAAPAYNQQGTVASIAVTTAGKKRLKLLMATKNASSTNYYGTINHVQLLRTA